MKLVRNCKWQNVRLKVGMRKLPMRQRSVECGSSYQIVIVCCQVAQQTVCGSKFHKCPFKNYALFPAVLKRTESDPE